MSAWISRGFVLVQEKQWMDWNLRAQDENDFPNNTIAEYSI